MAGPKAWLIDDSAGLEECAIFVPSSLWLGKPSISMVNLWVIYG